MQLKQLFVAGCIVLAAFASCSKKDKTEPTVVSVEGDWAGKYSILSQPYNNFYGFKVKPGGVMELQDSIHQITGSGTWELEGTIFSATYSFLPPATGTFSVIATFHNTTGKMEGTWGVGQQIYGGGYWYMNKIP